MALIEVPDDVRWFAILSPDPARPGQGLLRFHVHASDVTFPEVAHVTAMLVPALIARGGQRLPTEAEQKEQAAAAALAEAYPATRLLIHDGQQVWLGDQAVETGILARLLAAGWIDGGKVAVRGQACDYQRDPAGLLTRTGLADAAKVDA